MPTDMESTESRGLPYDVLFEDASQDHTTPLPTPNDIESGEIISNREWGANVIKIQQRYIMKFDRDVRPIEVNNMLYVAKHTTIPVTRVYAIYQRKEDKKTITYILMEYIPGKSLMDLWSDIDPTRKTSIARTLRTYFDQLRQLKHPEYFGTIHGGPPNIHLFMQDDITGPLKSEREFVDAIIRSYAIELGPRGAQKVRYYQLVLPAIFNGDNSPYSHITTSKGRTSWY
ncbi:hypothetical protein QWA68_007062 [Fusarium oxysporum]|nr:hypothetical protein QWA68_007062 [Fusarium oxysporum]